MVRLVGVVTYSCIFIEGSLVGVLYKTAIEWLLVAARTCQFPQCTRTIVQKVKMQGKAKILGQKNTKMCDNIALSLFSETPGDLT